MTDSPLRELERRFHLSGCVQDEATWLRARVQAGELEQSKLELAVYCGHEAAREAQGAEVPQVIIDSKRVDDLSPREQQVQAGELLVLAVFRWPEDYGPVAAVRSGLGLTYHLRTTTPRDQIAYHAGVPPQRPVPNSILQDADHLLHAVEDWVLCPCESHRRACAELLQHAELGMQLLHQERVQELRAAGGPLSYNTPHDHDSGPESMLARAVAATNGADGPRRQSRQAKSVFRFCKHLFEADADLQAIIRTSLVPWLLSTGDPIRLRVAKRGQGETSPDPLA
jgi:hypothetical protein